MKYDSLTGTYRIGYQAGFGIKHLAKPQAWLNYVNINMTIRFGLDLA